MYQTERNFGAVYNFVFRFNSQPRIHFRPVGRNFCRRVRFGEGLGFKVRVRVRVRIPVRVRIIVDDLYI